MTYIPSKSPVLKLWNIFGATGAGRWLVSKIVCFKAPYFSSIKPVFSMLQPGQVELRFKKRRAVTNHLQSVHAIAMCNAAELAAGICMDISLSANLRWIPVGMEVKYLKMAKTDLLAVCKAEHYHWDEAQDVVLPVSLLDTNNEEVFNAKITMRVSARKQ
jgi:acyl-coenzyme A thioesterase PaaI-like protein